MFNAKIIAASGFRFSPTNESAVHADKMRGIINFGPYRALEKDPKIGFVFPNGANEYANKLYLALRNGIGYFKGTASLLRYNLQKQNVFSITGFDIDNPYDHESAAKKYSQAIEDWLSRGADQPDILIILHSKSLGWEEDSAYSSTKAALLSRGITSQNVTYELIDNPSNFEWSVANIALNLFVKLGGVPWVSNLVADESSLVIGMGRAESFDPLTREKNRFSAFTTCFRNDGLYRFSTFGGVTDDRKAYLLSLEDTVRESIKKAKASSATLNSLILHLPKEFSRDEYEIVSAVLEEDDDLGDCQIVVVKVSEEDRFYAFDDSQFGVLRRGTCVKLGRSEYLLYTEGSDEKGAWRSRLPTALRVNIQRSLDQTSSLSIITQVLDLSLMNWRGFNAKAMPVSIFYSSLMAKGLSSLSAEENLEGRLPDGLWFL